MNISLTICGDGGAGKSSITLRLVRSQWVHEYDPTIEDAYSVTRTIDGIPYVLAITDTAGQEEYRGLWTAATLQSDAFLLVYDITNAASLAALDPFMDLIEIEADQRREDHHRRRKDIGMPPPIKIVAGNKCDLKESRVISAREGLEYARRHGCGFMETSAREMVNIEETLALLIRRVVEARQSHDPYGEKTAQIPPPSRAPADQPSTDSRHPSPEKPSPKSASRGLRRIFPGSRRDGQEPSDSESLWQRMRCC